MTSVWPIAQRKQIQSKEAFQAEKHSEKIQFFYTSKAFFPPCTSEAAIRLLTNRKPLSVNQ